MDGNLVVELQVDSDFGVDGESRQVVCCWIFYPWYMGEHEVKLQCSVTMVPQFGRDSFRLEEACQRFVVGHDNCGFFDSAQYVCREREREKRLYSLTRLPNIFNKHFCCICKHYKNNKLNRNIHYPFENFSPKETF